MEVWKSEGTYHQLHCGALCLYHLICKLSSSLVLLKLILLQFFCFPPVLPVTASLMSTCLPFSSIINTDRILDYVSAVIGIFAIFLIGYWLLYGKKTFQGPVSVISSRFYRILTNLSRNSTSFLARDPSFPKRQTNSLWKRRSWNLRRNKERGDNLVASVYRQLNDQ